MDGVDVVLDTATAVIDATGLVVTPGGIDTHVHWLSPQVCDAALAGGLTTLVDPGLRPGLEPRHQPARGGRRPAWAALEAHAVNAALLVRASSSRPEPVEHALRAGGAGLKIHEDVSAGPEQIRTALDVADRHDVQLAIHTDGLNEALSVEDTYAAFGGRTVHAFHIEGCGGGHAPDLLNLAGRERILTSSTSPTVPFGVHAEAEHLAMVAAVHVLAPGGVSGDWTALRARVRPRTMAAEGVLHDLGVIHDALVRQPGHGPHRRGRAPRVPERRVDEAAARRRSPARATTSACCATWPRSRSTRRSRTGSRAHVGSLQPGRLADAVLWRPELFAVRPEIVLKSGIAAWGASGDPNATTMLAEPVLVRRQIGAEGAAAARLSAAFLARAAMDAELPSTRPRLAGRGLPRAHRRGHGSQRPHRRGPRGPAHPRGHARRGVRRRAAPGRGASCQPDTCSARPDRSRWVMLLTVFPMDGTANDIPEAFSVDELDVDGVPVLTVHGDLDIGTAPRLCWRIDEARRRWIRALVLDLTETDFCDSTGLRALAGADRELTAAARQDGRRGPASGRWRGCSTSPAPTSCSRFTRRATRPSRPCARRRLDVRRGRVRLHPQRRDHDEAAADHLGRAEPLVEQRPCEQRAEHRLERGDDADARGGQVAQRGDQEQERRERAEDGHAEAEREVASGIEAVERERPRRAHHEPEQRREPEAPDHGRERVVAPARALGRDQVDHVRDHRGDGEEHAEPVERAGS